MRASPFSLCCSHRCFVVLFRCAGQISYAEFFQSFQLSDPKFSQTLERSKSFHAPPETIKEETDAEAETGAEGEEDAEVAAANLAAEVAAASVAAAASDHDLRSLSPRHSHDGSPPRAVRRHSLNDGTDHDATSSSHMHRSTSKPQPEMTDAEREAEEASTASEGEGDEPGSKKQRT